MQPGTRSFAVSSPMRSGAGATLTSCTWNRCRNAVPTDDHDCERVFAVTRTSPLTAGRVWPTLATREWSDMRATLHLWTQMVGKTRLALSPFENHYWHVASYVTARGLGTSAIPHRGRTFELEFDFVAHEMAARTGDGATEASALEPRSVAEFSDRYRAILRSLGIEVKPNPKPSEV